MLFSKFFHGRADAGNDTKDAKEVALYAKSGAITSVMFKDEKESLVNLADAAAINQYLAVYRKGPRQRMHFGAHSVDISGITGVVQDVRN